MEINYELLLKINLHLWVFMEINSEFWTEIIETDLEILEITANMIELKPNSPRT